MGSVPLTCETQAFFPYPSWSIAREIALHLNKHGRAVWPFRCTKCGKWHLSGDEAANEPMKP